MNQDDLDTLIHIFGAENVIVLDGEKQKMTGTIRSMMAQKRFGFVKTEKGDVFLHQSEFNGFWDDLEADFFNGVQIKLEFDVEQAPKGPRAKNARRLDFPNSPPVE